MSIKKNTLSGNVTNTAESRVLNQLSKSALIDVLVHVLRMNRERGYGMLTPEAVVQACVTILAERGDKLPIIDAFVRDGVSDKTGKKSRNCKTQATRIDARAVGEIVVKGKMLVMGDLASYLFDVHGSVANGIHAIAALNHGRASARNMATQLLHGKLPRRITASNAATIAWLELRAEAYADEKDAKILDDVRAACAKARANGTNWVDALPDYIVCDSARVDHIDYVGSLADGRTIHYAPHMMGDYIITSA